MKYLIVVISTLTVLATAGADEKKTMMVSLVNVPLSEVLAEYSQASAKHVEVVVGVAARITARNEAKMSKTEYCQLLENELREKNIGLFAISTNRLVATWIDLSKVKSEDKQVMKQGRSERLPRDIEKRDPGVRVSTNQTPPAVR